MPDYTLRPSPPIGGTTYQGGTAYNQGLGNEAPTSFAAIGEGLVKGLDIGSAISLRNAQTAKLSDPKILASEQLQRDLANQTTAQAMKIAERQYEEDLKFGDLNAKIKAGQGISGIRLQDAQRQKYEAESDPAYIQAEIYKMQHTGQSDPRRIAIAEIQARSGALGALARASKGPGTADVATDFNSEGYNTDENGDPVDDYGDPIDLANQADAGENHPDTLAPMKKELVDAVTNLQHSDVEKNSLQQSSQFQRDAYQNKLESRQLRGHKDSLFVVNELLKNSEIINSIADPMDRASEIETWMGSMSESNAVFEQNSDKKTSDFLKAGIAQSIKTVGPENIQAYIDSKTGEEKQRAEDVYSEVVAATGDPKLWNPKQKTIAAAKLSSKYIGQPKLAFDNLQKLITEGPSAVDDPEFKDQMRMSEYVIAAQIASKNGTQTFTIFPAPGTAGGDGDARSTVGAPTVMRFTGADGTIKDAPAPQGAEQKAHLSMVEDLNKTLNEYSQNKQNTQNQGQAAVQRIGDRNTQLAEAAPQQTAPVGAGPRVPQTQNPDATRLKVLPDGRKGWANPKFDLQLPESGHGKSLDQTETELRAKHGDSALSPMLVASEKRAEPHRAAVLAQQGALNIDRQWQDYVGQFLEVTEGSNSEDLMGPGAVMGNTWNSFIAQASAGILDNDARTEFVNKAERLKGEGLLTHLRPGGLARTVDSGPEQKTVMNAKVNENTTYENLRDYHDTETARIRQEGHVAEFKGRLLSDIEHNDPNDIQDFINEYQASPASRPLKFNADKFDENGKVKVGREKDHNYIDNDKYMRPFDWFKKYGHDQSTSGSESRQPTNSPQPLRQRSDATGSWDDPSNNGAAVNPQGGDTPDVVSSPTALQEADTTDPSFLANGGAPPPEQSPSKEALGGFFSMPEAEAQDALQRGTPPVSTDTGEKIGPPGPTFAENKGVKFESPEAEKRHNQLVAELSNPETTSDQVQTAVDWLGDAFLLGNGEEVGTALRKVFTNASDDEIKTIETAREEARARFLSGGSLERGTKLAVEGVAAWIESAPILKGLSLVGKLPGLSKIAPAIEKAASSKFLNDAPKGTFISGIGKATANTLKNTPEFTKQALADGLQTMATVDDEGEWEDFLKSNISQGETGSVYSILGQLGLGGIVKIGSKGASLAGRKVLGEDVEKTIARKAARNGQYRQELIDSLQRVKDEDLLMAGELPGPTRRVIQEAAEDPTTAPNIAATSLARQVQRAEKTLKNQKDAGLDLVRPREELQKEFVDAVSTQEASKLKDFTDAAKAEADTAATQVYNNVADIVEPLVDTGESAVNARMAKLDNFFNHPGLLFKGIKGGAHEPEIYLRSRGAYTREANNALMKNYRTTRTALDSTRLDRSAVERLNKELMDFKKNPIAEPLMRTNAFLSAEKGDLGQITKLATGNLGNAAPLAPTFKSLDEMRQLLAAHRGGPGQPQANKLIKKIEKVLDDEFESQGMPKNTYTNYIREEGEGRKLMQRWNAQADFYDDLANKFDTSSDLKSARDMFVSDYPKMREAFGERTASQMRDQFESVDTALQTLNKANKDATLTDVTQITTGIENARKLIGPDGVNMFAEGLVKNGKGAANRVMRELTPQGKDTVREGVRRYLLDQSENIGSLAAQNIEAGGAAKVLPFGKQFGVTPEQWKNVESILEPQEVELLQAFAGRQMNVNRAEKLLDVIPTNPATNEVNRAVRQTFWNAPLATTTLAVARFLRLSGEKENRAIINAVTSGDNKAFTDLMEKVVEHIGTKETMQGLKSFGYKGYIEGQTARDIAAGIVRSVSIPVRSENAQDRRFNQMHKEAAKPEEQRMKDYLSSF